VVKSGWLTTGPRVAEFEQSVAGFLGAPAAVALSSGTAAMEVALAALGIGVGDEVITSTMTFCSTAHVIEHVGATPVLVDVEPGTLNLSPEAVEAAVTARTKAILPVHLYGHPCDLDAIKAIAAHHGLHVVQDAAHALPAYYKGKVIGGDATPAAFSFYATKNVTTGEGGMLTGSPEFIEAARPWVLHGISSDAYSRYGEGGSWHYDVVLPGFKCNMTDLQAAIGIEQLKKLPLHQERRQQVYAAYDAAFAPLAELETPYVSPDCGPARHIYPLRLNLEMLSIDRDRFIEELEERNVGSSVHFIPVHMHSYYREKYGYRPEAFPVAYANYQRLISLPLHPGLSDAQVERVIQAVTDILVKYRR